MVYIFKKNVKICKKYTTLAQFCDSYILYIYRDTFLPNFLTFPSYNKFNPDRGFFLPIKTKDGIMLSFVFEFIRCHIILLIIYRFTD